MASLSNVRSATSFHSWPQPDNELLLRQEATSCAISVCSRAQHILSPSSIELSLASTKPDLTKHHIHAMPSSKRNDVHQMLTLILSDYLELAIEGMYHLFAGALTNKDTGPKLAPHLLTLLTTGFSKLLTKRFQKLAMIATIISPDTIERHTPVFLAAVKNLIDEMLADPELKNALIAGLADLAIPFILKKETIPLSSKEEDTLSIDELIVACVKSFDHFLEDYIQSTEESQKTQGASLEERLIQKINIRFSHTKPIFSLPYDKAETNTRIFDLTEKVFTSLLATTAHTSQEKEALVHIAALCVAKSADLFISPRTFLHIADTLLQMPIPAQEKNPQEPPSKIWNEQLAKALDPHLKNCVLHGAHLITQSSFPRWILKKSTRLILYFSAGKIGEKTAQTIYDISQDPDYSSSLNILHAFLYQPSHTSKPVATFKKFLTKTENDIQEKRVLVEQSLKAPIVFDKITELLKYELSIDDPNPSRLTSFFWKTFTTSSIARSYCNTITHGIYQFSQNELLIKMFYVYLLESVLRL